MNHNWSSEDIFLVSDLLEEDSQFLTFDTFKKINLCDKNSLSAVPQHGMCYRKSKTQMTSAKTNTKSLLSSAAFCKLAYKIFLNQSDSFPYKSQAKWLAHCNSHDCDSIDWGKSYNLTYFNLNFCTENWQQTIFFLKLESRLVINEVSAKKAWKFYCTSFRHALLINSFRIKLVTGWKTALQCFHNKKFSFLSRIGFVNDTTLLIARYHIYFSKQKGFSPLRELFFWTIWNNLDYKKKKSGTHCKSHIACVRAQ